MKENNGFEYQDALKLFEKYYFPDGVDIHEFWKKSGLNLKDIATDWDRNNGDGRSYIVGKSAFSPAIETEYIEPTDGNIKKGPTGDRFYLTLHKSGKFNRDFRECVQYVGDGNDIRIDITDMTKEEILGIVKGLLQMTNEQIMEKFQIARPYSADVKLELILDDVIQAFLAQKGINVVDYSYNPCGPIKNFTDDNQEIIQLLPNNAYHYHRVYIREKGCYTEEEYIYFYLLDEFETDLSKMRVAIINTYLKSELGELILRTLQERFMDRERMQDENEQENSEPSTVELLEGFMNTYGLSQDAILDALAKLGREGLHRNAMLHTIGDVTPKKEIITPKAKGE